MGILGLETPYGSCVVIFYTRVCLQFVQRNENIEQHSTGVMKVEYTYSDQQSEGPLNLKHCCVMSHASNERKCAFGNP